MNKRAWYFYAALVVPSGLPDVEITQFQLVESTRSQRQIEIQSDKAQVFKKNEITLLHAFVAKVWGSFEEIYEIAGQIAVYHMSKKDMRIEGETQIQTPDLYVFKTRNVNYDAKEGRLEGSEPVSIESSPLIKNEDNFRLKGVGLRIDVRNRTYRIQESIESTQDDPVSKARLNISSQSFLYNGPTGTALFEKNVKLKHPDYRMEGDRLSILFQIQKKGDASGSRRAQELFLEATPNSKSLIRADLGDTLFRSKGFKIHLGPGGEIKESEAIGEAVATLPSQEMKFRAERLQVVSENGVQKIRMEKGVKIETKTKTAQCEKALFIPSTGDFILESVASLKEGAQVVTGDRIQFSTKNNILRVEKARGELPRENLGVKTTQ